MLPAAKNFHPLSDVQMKPLLLKLNKNFQRDSQSNFLQLWHFLEEDWVVVEYISNNLFNL